MKILRIIFIVLFLSLFTGCAKDVLHFVNDSVQYYNDHKDEFK